jgi:hypothetical protein
VIARATIDVAATTLRETLPVFTRGNLFHATARVAKRSLLRPDFDAALARRLAHEPLDGLLHAPSPRRSHALSPREQRAYFPAGILLVDRSDVVDLFAASGALVQARVAVVDVDGHPREVVRWLVAAARAGHGAPIGYVHDASTVLYPFFAEPLATLTARARDLAFRDLGFPRAGFVDPYSRARVYELEAASPSALVAYALREILGMLDRDAMLAPIAVSNRSHSLATARLTSGEIAR